MTEEEKKRRALELFAQENARLRSCSPLSNPAFDEQMKKIHQFAVDAYGDLLKLIWPEKIDSESGK